MTETTTFTNPPPEAQSASVPPTRFSDILMSLIVAFLAPMFLSVTGGDINFARMAAAETVAAYQARNKADLIPIAQVIACGLTALGSLGLSMADNLSLSMTLRLRGNAIALDRVAEHNRRALRETRIDHPVPHKPWKPAVSPPEPTTPYTRPRSWPTWQPRANVPPRPRSV